MEWKAGNQIERRSGIHCTAASESNKGEQEQRKWKAEREMGKCWNKGSDEKRGGLWKRAGECVARFNDGAALNSAVNTTTCTFSFMSFLSVPPRACSFVSPCVHQQYGLCYIIYQYCFFVSWVHINTILLDWKGKLMATDSSCLCVLQCQSNSAWHLKNIQTNVNRACIVYSNCINVCSEQRSDLLNNGRIYFVNSLL